MPIQLCIQVIIFCIFITGMFAFCKLARPAAPMNAGQTTGFKIRRPYPGLALRPARSTMRYRKKPGMIAASVDSAGGHFSMSGCTQSRSRDAPALTFTDDTRLKSPTIMGITLSFNRLYIPSVEMATPLASSILVTSARAGLAALPESLIWSFIP